MSAKLRILIGVPTLLAGQKTLLKAVGSFYALKAEFKTGVILSYSSKLERLSELCFCSERTFRTYLKVLEKKELVKISSGRIELVSWEKLHTILQVTENKGKYHYKKQTVKPELILRAAAIQENLERQEGCVLGIIEKYNKGSRLSIGEKKQKREADLQRLIAAFKNPALLHHGIEDIFYNPDVAISQKTLANMYGLKSQGSGSYWQAILKKNKLIEIENRHFESGVRSRLSKLGKVHFSNKTMKSYLQMPNKTLCL